MSSLPIRFAAVVLLMGIGSALQASSIGLNYQGNNFGGAPTPLAPADVAGVVAQQNWNNDNASNVGALNNLVDNTGAATGVNATWNSNGLWGVGNGAATGDQKLMNGYIDNTGGNVGHFDFTNIPYSSYDVYVYVGSDGNGRPGQVILNGGAAQQFVTGDNPFPGYINNVDYVVFTGVTGASLDIGVQSTTGFNVGTHGIQIVSSVSSVPEPTSLALFGIGAGIFGLLRRRQG